MNWGLQASDVLLPLLTVVLPPSLAHFFASRFDAQPRAAIPTQAARQDRRADKLELCEQTSEVTGVIGSRAGSGVDLKNAGEYQKARREFETIYWAELPLVENREVQAAMVGMRGELYRLVPNRDDIRDAAFVLAHAIRRDL